MSNIVIVGSSGHGQVVADVIEKENKHNIVGFIDPTKKVGDQALGYEVLGADSDLAEIYKSKDVSGAIVAIGDNFVRSQVVEKLLKLCPEIKFVNAVHPSAVIGKGTDIGQGTVVMAGAVVNTSCRIGEFCILNTGCSLDHDSVMDDFSSLAPGVVTGGYCDIGKYSAISIGSVLKDRIKVGEHTVVGAGSLVLKDIEGQIISYGTPAEKIRSREQGEKYL